MLDAEHIVAMQQARESRAAGRLADMHEVSEIYNGRKELPLPELSKSERAAVPNLLLQGTDQMARRIASVEPVLTFPALRPGIQLSEEKADKRRQIAYGWLHESHSRKLLHRRARWLIAYASAPVIIRPDPVSRMPMWEPHSPFDIFPAATHIDSFTPEDVIVRHRRTLAWLEANYPEQAAAVERKRGSGPDTTFEVLEYIGADEIVTTVTGHKKTAQDSGWSEPSEPKSLVLTRLPNRAGKCWAVIPQRVSLDAPVGQFDGIMGMYATQAALMALQIIATRRAIWPHTYLVNPNTGVEPRIAQEPDPETGTPGIVVNGIIDRQQLDPSFQALQVIDTLESSQRQTASLPAELGGSGSQNVRTGRRGSQIMSASIDFTIAEAQDAFAESIHDELERAIAIDKAYFNTSKSIYVSTKGARGKVDYKPSEVWEEKCNHIVEYPIAGTDLSDLVINAGQRISMGTISKRRFMDIDPLVDDSEAEEQRVRFEAVELAFLGALQTLASNPDGPMQLPDLIRLGEKMFKDNKPWFVAGAELQDEKQKEQAQGAPPGAPETQPGLAMPGQGAEVPAIGEPGPSMSNLTQILNQLGSADTALAMR